MTKLFYRNLLGSVSKVLNFIKNEDIAKRETSFMSVDLYFEADMGYLIEGLEALSDALKKRIGD